MGIRKSRFVEIDDMIIIFQVGLFIGFKLLAISDLGYN